MLYSRLPKLLHLLPRCPRPPAASTLLSISRSLSVTPHVSHSSACVCVSHIFFTHPPGNGHLGCFHAVAMVNTCHGHGGTRESVRSWFRFCGTDAPWFRFCRIIRWLHWEHSKEPPYVFHSGGSDIRAKHLDERVSECSRSNSPSGPSDGP